MQLGRTCYGLRDHLLPEHDGPDGMEVLKTVLHIKR